VLVTIVGTLKETQTLDELLPALLQTEQQTRQQFMQEEELFPVYGAAASVKSCYYCKKPGQLP